MIMDRPDAETQILRAIAMARILAEGPIETAPADNEEYAWPTTL
jgi:hypothetical protein